MLSIECKGSSYQIGWTHGSAAPEAILRCIGFYMRLFQEKCNLSWEEVLEIASQFEGGIKANWPSYYEEMKGIADGSGRQFLEIIALNVRTEIAYGRFSDGCTSVSLHTRYCSFLGQNWDWETEQSDNLLLLTIIRNGFPTIKMVTEAGLIGKIGLNSSGVGVCLNAIKAKGLDSSRIPVHLALRQILESTSARGAVEVLKSVGISSAAHFLIGDAETAIGLESTSSTIFELYPDSLGRVFHTNHLIGHHEGVVEPGWLPDSNTRLGRIQVLADQVMINPKKKSVALETFGKMFADEDNYPSSICRAEEGVSDCATLFSISMDLQNSKAVITLGRPSESSNIITCQF